MTYYNAGEKNEAVAEMLHRWNRGDGKPMKGSLVDMDAYTTNPDDLGCMCAQGQVLHLVGGMQVDEIARLAQDDADRRVMRELGISHTHTALLRLVNDSVDGAPSIVLTHPEKVLGDEAPAILAFWKYLDTLDCAEWKQLFAAIDAAENAAIDAACTAGGAAIVAAIYAARYAAEYAARNAAGGAAIYATWEIQGHKVLEAEGKPLLFLSFFGFNSVKDVLDWKVEAGV